MRTSLLDQLDTLRRALDLASGEADYAQDIARRENPSLRSALQALDLDLWRLMRRVEALQTAQEATASCRLAYDMDTAPRGILV